MRITWNELTVSLENQNPDDFLTDWRWLVGEEMQLFMICSCGDMFLTDAQGHVFWLDCGMGQLMEIAACPDKKCWHT